LQFRDIDPGGGAPVYLQLKEQILHALSRGRVKAGEQLPTVREVAVALTINPNTVNRAYAELEREGILETHRGRGTFVAEHARKADAAAQATRLKAIARRALGEARSFGFSSDELLKSIARVAREDHF